MFDYPPESILFCMIWYLLTLTLPCHMNSHAIADYLSLHLSLLFLSSILPHSPSPSHVVHFHPHVLYFTDSYLCPLQYLCISVLTSYATYSSAMNDMGDKINSKKIAKAAGCYVIPGFEGGCSHAMPWWCSIAFPSFVLKLTWWLLLSVCLSVCLSILSGWVAGWLAALHFLYYFTNVTTYATHYYCMWIDWLLSAA